MLEQETGGEKEEVRDCPCQMGWRRIAPLRAREVGENDRELLRMIRPASAGRKKEERRTPLESVVRKLKANR